MKRDALYRSGLVCTHGSDGRGRNRYRKTDLTRIVTERQIQMTYGYRLS